MRKRVSRRSSIASSIEAFWKMGDIWFSMTMGAGSKDTQDRPRKHNYSTTTTPPLAKDSGKIYTDPRKITMAVSRGQAHGNLRTETERREGNLLPPLLPGSAAGTRTYGRYLGSQTAKFYRSKRELKISKGVVGLPTRETLTLGSALDEFWVIRRRTHYSGERV